ncbi:MAG TPA: lipase maturation factor family protein [bacterium]|nr:lipase maturation factor family protein [bacterium]
METVSTALKARWIYLRGLGFCFLATFLSLAFQARGLIGTRGLFPVAESLAGSSILKTPTLFWLGASEAAVLAVVWAGVAGAVLVLFNRANRVGLFICWLCFLSFVSVAPRVSWYKADSLLLEAAFLGIFLAPAGRRPGLGEKDPPTRIALAAHLWLLFRLSLETGLSKAFSPDVAWRDLSAMAYFHDNMPFPTWVGWLMGRMPYVFQKVETAYTLLAELLVPFLLLSGRRPRLVGILLWSVLQAGILVSGNFLSFSYQSIGLGLLFVGYPVFTRSAGAKREGRQALILVPQMAVGLLLLWSFPFFPDLPLPGPAVRALDALAPFRSANAYLLYPFIERERRVVILEGSNDGGATWREYGYQWQPQRLNGVPRFLSPLSDRFEREMQHLLERPGRVPYAENDFILRVSRRLIEGEGPVGGLFAVNPFSGSVPERVRASVYRYLATDFGTLLTTGHWWTRARTGAYCPDIARNPGDGRIDYVR